MLITSWDDTHKEASSIECPGGLALLGGCRKLVKSTGSGLVRMMLCYLLVMRAWTSHPTCLGQFLPWQNDNLVFWFVVRMWWSTLDSGDPGRVFNKHPLEPRSLPGVPRWCINRVLCSSQQECSGLKWGELSASPNCIKTNSFLSQGTLPRLATNPRGLLPEVTWYSQDLLQPVLVRWAELSRASYSEPWTLGLEEQDLGDWGARDLLALSSPLPTCDLT